MGARVEATDKEIVLEVLRRMPDCASLNDIVQELEFIAAVRQGMSELDENNDSVAIEKFEPKVPSWTVTIGRKRVHRRSRKRTSLMDYQVTLSPSARADIEDIIRYISIDNPDRALRFGRFLVQHTRSLGQVQSEDAWCGIPGSIDA